jgi:hypothetical protein
MEIDKLDVVEKWIVMVLGTLGEVDEEKLKLMVLLLARGFGDIWTDDGDDKFDRYLDSVGL